MSELIGRVTFGPRLTPEESRQLASGYSSLQGIIQRTAATEVARMCNCIGPQPGERKCPCQLAAETNQGAAMIRDGVTINGRKYRLVPED